MRRLNAFFYNYRIGISTIAIPILFAFYIIQFEDKEFHIKLAGMIMQLMGVYTVAYEIFQTRKYFGQPGIIEKTAQFFKDFLAIFNNEPVHGAHGFAELGALLIAGRGHTEFKAKSGDSIDRRVEILEEGLIDINARLIQAQREYDKIFSEHSILIKHESSIRKQGIEEIKLELKTLATGGLHISSMGLVWLTLGIVMATIPEQIVKLL